MPSFEAWGSPENDPDAMAALEALLPALRSGRGAKLRLLDIACGTDHRLAEVLRSSVGPLLLAWAPDRQGVTTVDRRGSSESALLYSRGRERARVIRLDVLGQEVRVEVECRCGPQQLSVGWVREQLNAGCKRVIYPASR